MFLAYLFQRNKYVIFTVILLTLSLFGGIYLVNQRHDLRQLAADDSGSGQWDECKLWSGGNYSELNAPSVSYPNGTHWFDAHNSTDIIKKVHYKGTVSLRWQSVFRCDYQKLMEKDGNVRECTGGDEDTWSSSNSKPHHPDAQAIYTTGYSPNLGELIDWSHDNGQCQVIQVDVGGCPGGTRFVVYVNDVCPTPTPTPTPTSTPTGTPTPTPTSTPTPDISCLYCHVYDQNWQQITDLDNLTIGEQIYFAAMGSGQITKGRFKVTVEGQSVDWQESTQQNENDEFYLLYAVGQYGTHHIKCEVYNPSSGWK